MENDVRLQINQVFDNILDGLGYKDRRVFWSDFTAACLVLTNLATLGNQIAASTEPDHGLNELLDSASDSELQAHLRFVVAIEANIVPVVKKAINAVTAAVEVAPVGRPRFAKNKEKETEICAYIHGLIGSGESEIKAKRLAANHFSEDLPKTAHVKTIDRIWKKRGQLLSETDAPAFFVQLIKTLASSSTVAWQRGNDGSKT